MCTTDPNAFSCSMALKKGPWTSSEDAILIEYVQKHGEGNWNAVQKHSGLSRCGKSCRLRWANHLRPNLKKCAFTPEEEKLIVQLHRKLGNKWARMAAQLPGRTDNEIKNYWNTRIKRRMRAGLPLYPAEDHEKKESQNFPAFKGLKRTRTAAAVHEYSASCSSSSGSIIQAQFFHHLPQFSLQLELPSSQSADSADSTSPYIAQHLLSEADSYGGSHNYLLEALLMQETHIAAPTPLITSPAINGNCNIKVEPNNSMDQMQQPIAVMNYTDEELSTLLDFAKPDPALIVPAEWHTNNQLAYVADQLVDLQEAAINLEQLLNAQVTNNQVWELGSFQWNNMPGIYQISDNLAAQTLEEPLYSDSSAIY